MHPHLKLEFEKKKRDRASIADTSLPEDASLSMDQIRQLLQQLSKIIHSEPSSAASAHTSGNSQTYLTSPSKYNSWIVNSGAIDHMANNPSSVHAFIHKSDTREVFVANGATVPVLGTGRVQFFPHCPTYNALIVPSFPTQLLSVGKITNSLNCDVIFSPTSVVFQDRTTKKKIGEGGFTLMDFTC